MSAAIQRARRDDAQDVESLSVEAATHAVEQAQTDREQAKLAVEAAKGKRAAAKAAFLLAPSAEGSGAVELAEQELRRADLWAEARFVQLGRSEKALENAKRAAAERDLERLTVVRDVEIRGAMADGVRRLQGLHAQMEQTIAVLLSLCARDAEVCALANAALRVAGIAAAVRATDPDLLRLATNILLTGGSTRPRELVSEAASRPFLALLREVVGNDKLTPAEIGNGLRLVVSEFARVSTALATDWLQPMHPPPQALRHTPVASRYRQAQKLLQALMQEGDSR